MKMLDKKLLAIIEKEEYGLALTLLVNGVTLTGILMSEEQFFVESMRQYGRQVNKDFAASREDFLIEVTRSIQDEHPYLHLSGVTLYLIVPISLPALRISPEHVSAWMFGLPGEDRITWRVAEDKIDDLERDFRKGINP
jgi:hypothetical protein